MIYYHNPRCSKSRQGLALLEENNVSLTIKEYLKEGLTEKELDALFNRLGKGPLEVMRTKEKIYKELNLKEKDHSRPEWIKIIVENPVLLERPILDTGTKAAIGRPVENLLQIL